MLTLKVETMAKKKTPAVKGRPKSLKGPRKQILSLRGYEEFRDWLGRLAHFKRTDMADVIDRALVMYAKAEGFEAPPDR